MSEPTGLDYSRHRPRIRLTGVRSTAFSIAVALPAVVALGYQAIVGAQPRWTAANIVICLGSIPASLLSVLALAASLASLGGSHGRMNVAPAGILVSLFAAAVYGWWALHS